MSEYIEDCPVLCRHKARITSDYGERIDPISGKKSIHTGIDLVPVSADRRVSAIDNGIVIDYMNTIKGYDDKYTKGNYVRIRHTSGRETIYLHMAANSVKEYVPGKSIVYKGDTLGLVGATGRATGAHLHFQVYDTDGSSIMPPTAFLKGLSINFVSDLPEFIFIEPCSLGEVSAKVVKLQRRIARISKEYEAEIMASSYKGCAWDGVYGSSTAELVNRIRLEAGWPEGDCDAKLCALLNKPLLG